MPKISALTSLAQASVDTAADVLPIVDATAPATTKKVTVQAMVNAGLAAAAPQGGIFALTGALTVSGQASITANSASAALTVTQTGAGNAFVVEDQASDTTQFGVSSGGQVFVGYTSQPFFISGVVPQFSTIGTNNTSGQFATVMYSNDASPTWLHLGKSRGAIGAQGIVSSGDTVGNIEFSASDGTIFTSVARIAAVVDGTPGTNDMPGRLVFSTTADGASSPTERMRIDSAGKVGIGTAALTNYSFLNGLALTGQTTMIGNGTVAQVNSDVTSLAVGYRSNLYTQAASFNCGAFYGFHAVQSTLGASSSVSFQAGFLAGSTLTGATSNYGFYSEIAAAANRWNFYAAGTAENFFAGSVGIGAISPAYAKLFVGETLPSSSTASRAVEVAATIPSTSTAQGFGCNTNLSTEAAAFTLTTLSHYRAGQGAIGAGSAVTNQFGFVADSTLTGATLNFGFYSNIAAAANRYNFYAAGTADNYFGGLVECANYLRVFSATATPAGGAANTGLLMGSAVMGVYFGSGAPTVSAAKGSLYLRSDGSTTNDRMYVNTNGSTTWTAVITAA